MTKISLTIKLNPVYQYAFVYQNLRVPTKQEWYTPLEGYEEIVYKHGNIFTSKPDTNSTKNFSEFIQTNLKNEPSPEWPLKNKLELNVLVSTDKKRESQIDIDNLLKSIFDAYKGILYVDDSQIISVLGQKFSFPDDHEIQESLMIGVRIIDTVYESIFSPCAKIFFGDRSVIE